MHRIDGAGHVNNRWVPEDLATNRPPTEITADWMNDVQESIVRPVEEAGIPPEKGNGDQLLMAMGHLFSRTVGSIAALKSLDKTKYTRAFVLGYYANGDGGGGAYWYDSTDATTADNGGTVIVGADGGRWKLSCSGIISVKQFGATGDGVTDDTARLQAAIDAAYYRKLVAPDGIYVHTGLSICKGIDFEGVFPPTYPDVDAVNNTSRGAILWKKTAGDSLTIQAAGYPASYAESEFHVRLGNLAVIGARYTGATFIGTAVTTGAGIVVNAGDAAEAAIHLSLDNVFSFSHPERGWSITGQVYGCNGGWIGAVYNGKNGFYYSSEAFTNIGGEFAIQHYRGFSNGDMGETEDDKSGVLLDHRGQSLVFGLLTSSNNYGPNFKLKRGGVDIQKLHCETQRAGYTSSLVVFGDGTAATQPCTIDAICVDPGNAYTLPVVKFNEYARNIRIGTLKIGDTGLLGSHVTFAAGASYNRIENIWALEALVVADDDGHNLVASRVPQFAVRLSATASNITGDSTNYKVGFDTKNFDVASNFNTGTFEFTVPTTGIYEFNVNVYANGADGVNHNTFWLYLMKNASDQISRVMPGVYPLTPTDVALALTRRQLLFKGNTVWVQFQAEGGAKTVDVLAGDAMTYFSGALVLPTTDTGGAWQ